MSEICVVGSNNIDLTTTITQLPKAGETIAGEQFAQRFGGKGANQAVAAAKLGATVDFLTVTGNDTFGQMQRDSLSAAGIQTAGVMTAKDASSGVATILVEPNGENRIITVAGANRALTASVVMAHKELLTRSQLVVLQQEISLKANYAAIDTAADAGVPVLLNPAPAAADFDWDYASKLAFLTPNQTELAALAKMPADTVDQAESAARKLLGYGVQNVIVTLGAQGAIWVGQDHSESVPAFNADVVDTTGAGDAFVGSFAAFFVSGESASSSLRHANRYAAISTQRAGTQSSYPTKSELKTLLAASLQQ